MLKKTIYYVFVLCVLTFGASVGEASSRQRDNRDRDLSVMTRNMYLGTDFDGVFSAPDQFSLFVAVGVAYSNVQAGNVPERISGIADEIEAGAPTLVGLQEVALWRTGTFGDPAAAENVTFDFLAMLHAELASRGLHYRTVVQQENLDAEVPAFINFAPAFDVRFTDRVVILARSDLKISEFKLEGTRAQLFAATFVLPGGLFSGLPIPRGWTSADVKMRGKNYRFVNAHLESFHPGVTVLQANELTTSAGNTDRALIFAGDFNSDAEINATGYQIFRNAGFADVWEQTHGNEPGLTWPLFLTSPLTFMSPVQRLDLILTRGEIGAMDADIVGEDPLTDQTPSGLMRSDHAGVIAILKLRP